MMSNNPSGRWAIAFFALFAIGLYAAPQVFSQNSAEDSLLNLVATQNDDTLRMQWYNQLRRLVIYDDPEKALAYCQKYGEYALKAGLPEEHAKARFYEANSYIPLGQYEKALESLFAAERFFLGTGEATRLGSIQNSIGAVFEAMGRDSLASLYFGKSHDMFVETGDQSRQAMALNNLSNIAYRQADYQRSKALMEKSIALTVAEEDLHRRKLNYANTLVALKEYDQALLIYFELLEQKEKLNLHAESLTLQGIGKLYAGKNEPQKAEEFLLKGLELSEKNGFVEDKLNILNHLAACQEEARNFEKAYYYFRDYQELKDSLSNVGKDKNLVEALARYETEKKENEIALLQKDKALAARKQLILALTGLALGLLALGSFVLYRNRRRNIRQLEEKNRTISKMLEEKEYLIREIHHRVKNNLQVISSLLQLQSRHVEEPSAAAALNEGESRVRSMSIIHHHLYTENNLGQVDLPRYIDSLCESLLSSYNYKKQDIVIDRDIENISLDVSVMVPLGLIVNELITNAFKYAFEGRERGRIWVRIREEGGALRVSVKDDGVGINGDREKGGFGTRLINTFLRKLEAEAETIVNNGTEVRISVKEYRKEAPRQMSA
jgi:two-component system, sensor histidine kinase PdtaS